MTTTLFPNHAHGGDATKHGRLTGREAGETDENTEELDDLVISLEAKRLT